MNFSTPRSHNEVDGALSTIPKTAKKVSDTRRGDDGVHSSTPRSHNEVDGALTTIPKTAEKVSDTRRNDDGVLEVRLGVPTK